MNICDLLRQNREQVACDKQLIVQTLYLCKFDWRRNAGCIPVYSIILKKLPKFSLECFSNYISYTGMLEKLIKSTVPMYMCVGDQSDHIHVIPCAVDSVLKVKAAAAACQVRLVPCFSRAVTCTSKLPTKTYLQVLKQVIPE